MDKMKKINLHLKMLGLTMCSSVTCVTVFILQLSGKLWLLSICLVKWCRPVQGKPKDGLDKIRWFPPDAAVTQNPLMGRQLWCK